MFTPLLILAISALLCLGAGWARRWAAAGTWVAVLGVAGALVVAVWREGIEGGGVVGRVLPWPQLISWLGTPIYRSDALSAGLGAWCLLLGLLCILKMAASREEPWRMAVASATVGVLYSLVHTSSLLAYAVHLLVIVLLVTAYRAGGSVNDVAPPGAAVSRQALTLGSGAAMLLGVALLVGRTTWGDYDLARVSLSAFTVWPMLLIAGFAIAWLGLLPLTGWSAEGPRDVYATLAQSLVIGVPVLVLLLRLEALVSAQALAGTLPGGWTGFTVALQWLGGLTAVVSAAGLIVWAGKERWSAILTTNAMSLALWGIGLDTPPGRYAALAILLAYGAGRVGAELCSDSEAKAQRWIAAGSLAALPGTVGFLGVWLLGAALSDAARPILAVALLFVVLLAACGVALEGSLARWTAIEVGKDTEYIEATGIGAVAALIVGGVLPGLWLPFVGGMSSIAGGNAQASLDWTGINISAMSAPLLLLLIGAGIMWAIGWIGSSAARPPVASSGTLLPSALESMQGSMEEGSVGGKRRGWAALPLLTNPPVPLIWLSLAWFDAALMRLGWLAGALGTRSGRLLGRLEGRFYLPMALIVALLFVLAITR